MAEAIAGELLLLRPSVTKELCDAARVSKVFLLHCILTVVVFPLGIRVLQRSYRKTTTGYSPGPSWRKPYEASHSFLQSQVEGSTQSFQLCWSRVFPREACVLYVAAGLVPALLWRDVLRRVRLFL